MKYGKRPLWHWIVLYLVIGGIVYGLVYYFVYTKKGGYSDQPVNLYAPDQAGTANTTAGKNEVTIKDYKFSPATITVKVGDKVTWTNQDTVPHTATANDKSFDTGNLNKGQSGSTTFTKPGTYPYICTVHPNMKATVIVEP